MHQVQDLRHPVKECQVNAESEPSMLDKQQPLPYTPQPDCSMEPSDKDIDMSPTNQADKPSGRASPIPFTQFDEEDTRRSRSRPRRKSYDSIKEVRSSMLK